jgi:hypothetical protein
MISHPARRSAPSWIVTSCSSVEARAEEMPLIKRLLAKIVGFDGAYHRFTGKVTIEKIEKDFDDHAIWELMYFGKTRSSHEPAYMLAATQ